MWAAALMVLIELHLVDGIPVLVNPNSIVSMRGRGEGKLLTEGAHCLLNLADGKYIAVRETCDQVKEMLP